MCTTLSLNYQHIIDKCFSKLTKDFELLKSNSTEPVEFFSSQSVLELTSVFGEALLESAFNILDSRLITVYQLPNFLKSSQPAELCEIQSSQKNLSYLLFPDINFCPCPAFEYQVLAENRCSFTCKHVLALKFAKILEKYKINILNKEQFNFMLLQTKK